MSNEAMEKYKALYSQYIDHAVNLHNYHLLFMRNVGEETGVAVRSNLKYMMRLEKQLQKACLEAWKEHRQNVKDELAKKRQARALKKLNPGKPGRPKGRKNGNNSSTTSPI